VVDVGLLAVADFEHDVAARDERRDGGGNEAAIDLETVFTGEEGHVGFVIANFYGKGRPIGDGNVWGIRNHEFELLANDRRKEISLQEANAISETHAFGIVARNAILLVDYTNVLRRRDKMPLREAVEVAGRTRLRPILMTSLATMLGLVPMALGIGEGSELQVPLARVVIGGLLTSTFITLVFVPTVYTYFEEGIPLPWKKRTVHS